MRLVLSHKVLIYLLEVSSIYTKNIITPNITLSSPDRILLVPGRNTALMANRT